MTRPRLFLRWSKHKKKTLFSKKSTSISRMGCEFVELASCPRGVVQFCFLCADYPDFSIIRPFFLVKILSGIFIRKVN